MKIMLVTDDGVLIDSIENIEEYDLNKPIARAEFCDHIRDEIEKQNLLEYKLKVEMEKILQDSCKKGK